jgi:hypothetical protein
LDQPHTADVRTLKIRRASQRNRQSGREGGDTVKPQRARSNWLVMAIRTWFACS